jgi:hypothetical protein
MRGVQSQGQLHSFAKPVLRFLVGQEAGAADGDDRTLALVQREVAGGAVGHLCSQHVKPPHAGLIWEEVLRPFGDVQALSSAATERCLHLLALVLKHR